MRRCPSCGFENDEGARFCSRCGTALEAPVPALEERKVVSILFVDLVGFTARSDRADPEDVRATLRVYHELLKREIERFGGTVEKFIGDAVMAVFGAPVAHEDDAERAVRAALRIVEAIDELNDERPGLDLAVRGAVNTGEAVVTLGARPEAGEGFVTGDVVNVASRLQGVAPVGGVVVGELTFRATDGPIEYTALDAVSVKGKDEPLAIWRADGARSRFGVDVEQRARTPLVGRDRELRLLEELFSRVVEAEEVQLVTIVGEPGVGKSRLLWELQRYVDDRPEIVIWRQGRCLPYGDGISYWALGEIVKSHAGVLESDDAADVARKLEVVVEEVVTDADERGWVRGKLEALLGIEGEGGGTRDEAFAAWRTFLEGIAAASPFVIVLEDVHWADEAMLAFIEHLVDWTQGLPILIVCTARPELYERAPGWGGGKRNATTVSLAPLSAEETATLIGELLQTAVLPADTQAALLERSGGNPLYAEEFVRMLIDRAFLVRAGSTWELSTDDVPVPEGVHALIAARLDTLAPERKALLHDAAVIGKVFWSGAISAVGDRDEAEVRESLHELARKELVRPARRPSIEGQAEYAFWHALIRDVAYGQIPRAARADKHLAVAGWLEGVAGERISDVAELLAYHDEQALELQRAAGAVAADLEARTGRAHFLVGERLHDLDPAKALLAMRRALELLPDGDPVRRDAVFYSTLLLRGAGEIREGQARAAAEVERARAAGDVLGEGVALACLGGTKADLGDGAAGEADLRAAVALLETQPESSELVRAYVSLGGHYMVASRSAEAIELADRALALIERLPEWPGRDRPLLLTMQIRGMSRTELGDLGGVEDVERALDLAKESGQTQLVVVNLTNLGDLRWCMEGPAAGIALHDEGHELGIRRGLTFMGSWCRAESVWELYDAGRWEEALSRGEGLMAGDRARSGEPTQLSFLMAGIFARAILHRGDPTEAADRLMLDSVRPTEESQMVIPAFETEGLIRAVSGDIEGLRRAVEQLLELIEGRGTSVWSRAFPELVRALLAAGERATAERLAERRHERHFRRDDLCALSVDAMLAEDGGDVAGALDLYIDASTGWGAFGGRFEEAHARLGAGRCRLALGVDPDADLVAARSAFAGMGAVGFLAEADRLLEAATAESG